MSAKPLPTVVLEPVFVRDQQRRLRLVMDLLEQELRQPQTPLAQDNEQKTTTEVHEDEDRRHLRPRLQHAAAAE